MKKKIVIEGYYCFGKRNIFPKREIEDGEATISESATICTRRPKGCISACNKACRHIRLTLNCEVEEIKDGKV